MNSIRLGLFDFMAKPFPLEAMKTTLERAFTDADLQSNKPTSLESIIERIEQLTKRELEICEKLSKGLSGKQIASELAISIKTYYVHRTNLLQKTGARSSIELIRAYDVYSINRRNGDHEDSTDGIEIAHLSDNSIGHENELPNFPLVSDIARKNVLQTDSDLTLRTAANLMIERDVSSIVFRKNGRLHVFSMENILEISHAGASLDQALSQMPIEPATTIEKDKNVLDALDQLELAKTRFLIVTDSEENDSMIGILTYSDLLSTIDPTLFLEKKNIGQIVSRKEPLTFSQEWHLDDVLCHLVQTEDSIIVVDAGKPIGIITAKDVFRIISSGQSTAGQLSEYMTHPVFSLPASATIHDALVHLKCKKVKRAVIVNEYGILIGMLTQSEVVSFAYGYWTKLFHHESHGLFELVTLLTKKAAKYETDSLTDPLTDLGNRRHLDSFIESEIERVRRYNAKTFSKLFIDIDHHKSVNDVHGHSFGDEVLKATGNAIRKLVRENDRVFRWGGDEFVVIAPHTELSEAEKLASRIRTSIETLSLSKEHRVTVSIGIGEYSPVEGLKSFFDRVDQALYQAKSLGRNRVEISSLNATLALIEKIKVSP
ncbi:MAG: diguanylate cyclase [Betaproteobacteria bacterium]